MTVYAIGPQATDKPKKLRQFADCLSAATNTTKGILMNSSAMFEERTSYKTDKDFRTVKIITDRRANAIAARIYEIKESCGHLRGVALESGLMSEDMVSGWLSGKREADATGKLSVWLDAVDSDIADRTGDFIMSPTSRRILSAFEYVREPRDNKGRRGVGLIIGSSGSGKTYTAEYAARLDNAISYVLVDGESRTWTGLLGEVARSLGSNGSARNGETLKSLVIRNMTAGGLLIVDHAHLLPFRIMEQLLTFPEENGIGLCFIGNVDLLASLNKQKLTQITSRASGATVVIDMPNEEEVDAHLLSLGITGISERVFCQAIGKQDGGLRYLYGTVRKAEQIAAGMGNVPISITLLKVAAKIIGSSGD